MCGGRVGRDMAGVLPSIEPGRAAVEGARGVRAGTINEGYWRGSTVGTLTSSALFTFSIRPRDLPAPSIAACCKFQGHGIFRHGPLLLLHHLCYHATLSALWWSNILLNYHFYIHCCTGRCTEDAYKSMFPCDWTLLHKVSLCRNCSDSAFNVQEGELQSLF